MHIESTKTVVVEENPKDLKTSKQISQVNNIKQIADQLIARENDLQVEKTNGAGSSVATDTKQIVQDYFKNLKPSKTPFKSVFAGNPDTNASPRGQFKRSHYESQKEFLKQNS